MVTYGAMSKEPLTVPPGLLIFNDLRLRGFWLTGGYAKVGGRLGCRRGWGGGGAQGGAQQDSAGAGRKVGGYCSAR